MHKKTYVCPYCFSEHRYKELCFRCTNVRCQKKPDQIYADYSCRAPELKQMVFPGHRKLFQKKRYTAVCPWCGSESAHLVCPSCHNTLPGMERNNETLLFSAVGGMDAGKSSYLAVLLHEFKRKTAYLLNGAASFMDPASAREYEDEFLQYLYPCIGTDPSIRLPKTKSALTGSSYVRANRPILMDFKTIEEGLAQKESKRYTFVFYDEAGEDFEEENVMFTLASHIAASDGIFFFVDPLKIPFVRNSLKEEVVRGAATTKRQYGSAADEILLRLVKVLRTKYQLMEEEFIEVPIAVIVSKLDVVAPLLSSSSPLLRDSRHVEQKGYVEQEGFDIQEELKGLLYEWGEQELMSHLAANFSTYQLFAVSAFGNNPDEYGRFHLPKPVRIEDPMLWMLKEMQVIEE